MSAATRCREAWLLAGLPLAALPLAGRLHPPVLLLAALCLLWRLLHFRRRLPLPGPWTRRGLALGGVLMVWMIHERLLGREAGASLLVLMTALKLLEARSERDAVLLVYLGYFLVAAAALFQDGLPWGLYAALPLLLLTAALAAPYAGGRPLARAGALLLQGLPLAAVLFLLFPRLDGPLWGLPADAQGGRTGLAPTVEPGALGALAADDSVAFRVRFHGPAPAPEQLYWRALVLDRFDGRRWSAGAAAPLPVRSPRPGALVYTLTLEPHQRRYLPVLEAARGAPPGAVLLGDGTVRARRPLRRTLSYRLAAWPGPAAVSPPTADDLYLPPGAAPRARALGARWRRAERDPRRLVERALAHFREKPFYYTLDPGPLEGDPVDTFLFETRRGYCEHYASAFAVLMRAAGVPARLVAGYQGGEHNPMGDYWLVRQADAHAWAEVWLPGRGWQRVDPTAAVPPERVLDAPLRARRAAGTAAATAADSLLGALWHRLHLGWDGLQQGWNTWVADYDSRRQRDLLEALGAGREALARLPWLLGLATAALGLAALLLLRPPRPADPVRRVYARFERRLRRRGLGPRPGEAPMALARRLAAQRPELGAAALRIARLYCRLRYAPRAGPEDLKRLRRLVRRFRPRAGRGPAVR